MVAGRLKFGLWDDGIVVAPTEEDLDDVRELRAVVNVSLRPLTFYLMLSRGEGSKLVRWSASEDHYWMRAWSNYTDEDFRLIRSTVPRFPVHEVDVEVEEDRGVAMLTWVLPPVCRLPWLETTQAHRLDRARLCSLASLELTLRSASAAEERVPAGEFVAAIPDWVRGAMPPEQWKLALSALTANRRNVQ